ncbi:MAG: CotH kinase family protein [Paraglaciecola sp.]|nr:CotH kinase family protein [Paraglaciecola sp.]
MDSYVGSTAHNYYLYEQRSNESQFSMLPWDFNLAMGTMRANCDATEFLIDEPTDGLLSSRPLVEKLLTNSAYLEQYRGYIQDYLNQYFSVEVMNSKIDAIEIMIDQYVQDDPTKFYTYE